MGWFKKKQQSVGKMETQGKKLRANPNPDMSLERARGRLERLDLAIAKRSNKKDKKRIKLQKTRDRMAALIFYLTDDDDRIKENV